MFESVSSGQIEMLRVQLETAFPKPIVLVVTSAMEGDGKNVLALSLAKEMDAAGYSTLLVLADELTREVDASCELDSLSKFADRDLQPHTFHKPRSGLTMMALSSRRIRDSVSVESVARFVDYCRTSYQITIIEAIPSLQNPFSRLLAIRSDAVILAAREGRRVRTADRQFAKVLERDDVTFIGVVTIDNETVRRTLKLKLHDATTRSKLPAVAPEIEAVRKRQTV